MNKIALSLAFLSLVVLTTASHAETSDQGKTHFETQSRCLHDLSSLHDRALESLSKEAVLRDGLFTFAVLETQLLTGSPFINAAKNGYRLIELEVPDADWGESEIKDLEKKLKFSEKRSKQLTKSWSRAFEGGYYNTAADHNRELMKLSVEIAITQEQIETTKLEREAQLKLREERKDVVTPKFKDLPSKTQVKIATRVWLDLVNTYSIHKSHEELSLEEIKTLTQEAKSLGMSYSDFVTLSIATEKIEDDPQLTESVVSLIAELLSSLQSRITFDSLGFRKTSKYQKALNDTPPLQRSQYKLETPNIVMMSPQDTQLSYNGETTDLKTLLTETNPLLFSDSYFHAMGEAFKKENIKPVEFSENFDALSPVVKEALVKNSWDELKNFYLVQKLADFRIQDGAEVSRRSKLVQISPDTFLKNAYLIKAIDEVSSSRQATLKLMSDTLKEAMDLTPHVQNAIKWKNENTKPADGKQRALLLGATVASSAAMFHAISGADMIAHLHPLQTLATALTEVETPMILSTGGYYLYNKIREKFSRRKANRGLAKLEKSHSSNHGDAE